MRSEAAGKHCGIVAISDDNVKQRLEQGFGAIALGMDARLTHAILAELGIGEGRSPAIAK